MLNFLLDWGDRVGRGEVQLCPPAAAPSFVGRM